MVNDRGGNPREKQKEGLGVCQMMGGGPELGGIQYFWGQGEEWA